MRFALFNAGFHNYALRIALAALARELGRPAVLLVNEVPRGRARSAAGALGPGGASAFGSGLTVRGVCAFRQAVIASAGVELTRLASLALGRSRHALLTRVRADGRPLLVALAHLTNERPLAFGRRQGVRARELEDLVRGLRRRRAAGEPLVLGGDFNFARLAGGEAEHAAAERLLGRELGVVDVAARLADGTLPAPTWPSPGMPGLGLPPQRFDLFYVSEELLGDVREHAVLPWPLARTGSDHRPVVLTLA